MKSEGAGIVISASPSICCGEGRQKHVSAYLPQATLPTQPTWQICLKFWNLQHQRPKDDFATASEGQKISDEVCLVRSDFFKAVQSCFNDMGTSVCVCACVRVCLLLVQYSVYTIHMHAQAYNTWHCARGLHTYVTCASTLCVLSICACVHLYLQCEFLFAHRLCLCAWICMYTFVESRHRVFPLNSEPRFYRSVQQSCQQRCI